MEKLNYSELAFLQNALTYYLNHETKIMKQIYTNEEIAKFRISIQELNNKIEKIKEGE